jgi:hypothetical protein
MVEAGDARQPGLARLNDWLRVAGLFGVIASLVFVGLQMRQQQAIALSVASQARTETTIQAIQGQFTNPYYMSGMDKLEAGDSLSLTPSERRAVGALGLVVLFNFENVHYQYLNGFVAEARWVGTLETLRGVLMQQPPVAAAYRRNPSAWRASFQVVIDSLLAEIDGEPGP